MNPPENSVAFGAPGIEPRWTSSAKNGLGTAYHTSCRLWFTLSHGIVNEIYYPSVDAPNTRDFQFLISDGATFCHEEKRDLDHQIQYPERDCLFYRLTNSERSGRYRLVKHVLTDPHRSVLLVHTKIGVLDESVRGKLRLYALLAPHIARHGAGNSGWCSEISGNKLLHAERKDVHLILGCSRGFSRRSVGFVGASDGWQDLMNNFRMDWEFRAAENGNIALTGEIDLQGGDEFTLAIALGRSYQSTVTELLQSLAQPFDVHHQSLYPPAAHEDKTFQGALVASMSIPWGETKGDNDLGGYHLVWTRDLVQSATALLITGQTGTPLRALISLAAIQRTDGRFPQNSWINGNAYWSGMQLDEIVAPILLAWRRRSAGDNYEARSANGRGLCHCVRRMLNMSHSCAVLTTASVLTGSNRHSSAMSLTRCGAGMKSGASATSFAECPTKDSCASSLRQMRLSSGQPMIGRATNRADTTNNSALNLWFADLPTENCPGGLVIEFTFFWKEAQRWEGRNYSVVVSGPK